MTTNYILSTSELNEGLLKSIKAAFGKKEIIISVSDSIDETEYLQNSVANKKSIEKSIQQIRKGDSIVFKGTEFSKVAKSKLK